MFGFSFGELIVLIIVAMVVIGPKELPKVLRKLGQWSGKIRRFAMDMRVQSGIDEALRTEGLDQDLAEIRKLARGELDGVVAATRNATRIEEASPYAPPPAPIAQDDPNAIVVDGEREYPREGADSYAAMPDTAIVYSEGLPRSKWADDPLYVTGDANGVIAKRESESAGANAGAGASASASATAPDAPTTSSPSLE